MTGISAVASLQSKRRQKYRFHQIIVEILILFEVARHDTPPGKENNVWGRGAI